MGKPEMERPGEAPSAKDIVKMAVKSLFPSMPDFVFEDDLVQLPEKDRLREIRRRLAEWERENPQEAARWRREMEDFAKVVRGPGYKIKWLPLSEEDA